MSVEPRPASLVPQPPAGLAGGAAPAPAPAPGRQVHQAATAAESAVVIQVGGDLYLSDPSLGALFAPPPATTPGQCPYPGLDAFGPGQAAWFYGRVSVTGDLLRLLDQMARGGPGGPLLLVAPSGTGKSSVLGAGLLSALAEGRLPVPGSDTWPQVMITPGPHPLATLRQALATLAAAQAAPPASPVRAGARDGRVVLVIDQLEEIFTVCDSEAQRAGFLDEVATLAADAGAGSALIVAGMRADFYARATRYPVLRQAMQSRQVVLGAMSAAEVRQAIVRPARAAGLSLEAGLAERLLHDLGVDESAPAGPAGSYEAGRLPLLGHALRATWQLREGTRLTIAGYQAAGGIAGAIARTAEDVYLRLDGPGQAAARQLLLALVRVGSPAGDSGEAADTRRRVLAGQLLDQAGDPVAARATLEAFTAARLVTSGGQAVEITHEALLSRWPRLQGWIEEDRSGLLARQELEDAAAAWNRSGREAGTLYGGARLAAAQQWAASPARARELSPAGRDFLAAAERRRRRGTRQRNAVIAALAALSLVLAGLSAFALNQRSDAQGQRAVAQRQQAAAQSEERVAESGLLAAESGQAWNDFRPDTAQELATQAYRLDPGSAPAVNALLAAQTLPIAGRLLDKGGQSAAGEYHSVSYNPSGTLVAAGDSNGMVHLWSAASYQELWTYQYKYPGNQVAPVDGVAFTPDGKTLAVTQPGVIWLWNVTSPARPAPAGRITMPPAGGTKTPQVTALAFSAGGTLAAASLSAGPASSAAGQVVLISLATRAVTAALPQPYLASGLQFSPDASSLLLVTANGGVELWNVAARRQAQVIAQPSGTTLAGQTAAAALSPDGQLIAYAAQGSGTSYEVKLWSVAARQVTATVPAGAAGAGAVAFSPDGRQFAVSELSGVVLLYERSTRALLGTFSGHRAAVAKLAFSPDSTRLASASYDGTIGLWNTRGTTLDGTSGLADNVALAPGGRTLAIPTVTSAGTVVALYGLPSRTLIRDLPVSGLVQVAYSPDGATLATQADSDGVVSLWNAATGRLAGTLRTGLPVVSTGHDIAFSPDGALLVVSSAKSGVMQVWNVAQRAKVASVNVGYRSTLPQLAAGVLELAFSADGKVAATLGTDGAVRLWSVPAFSFLTMFSPGSTGASLAFSPDGRELAVGTTGGDVLLYPLAAAGKLAGASVSEEGQLGGSSKAITAVSYISGRQLIAGGADGDVRFWNVPPGSTLASYVSSATAFYSATTPAILLATHMPEITDIAYSAPLSLLATASPSGSRVWQASPAAVAASVCASLKAPVRRSLWTEYLPGIAYTPVCGT